MAQIRQHGRKGLDGYLDGEYDSHSHKSSSKEQDDDNQDGAAHAGTLGGKDDWPAA